MVVDTGCHGQHDFGRSLPWVMGHMGHVTLLLGNTRLPKVKRHSTKSPRWVGDTVARGDLVMTPVARV